MDGQRPLIIGTRGSPLALAQARWVQNWLQAHGTHTRIQVIRTQGDIPADLPLPTAGSGLFTGAVQEALLQGRVDVAVHSLKDLPIAPLSGLTLAAVPLRADPLDAWVGRPPAPGACVGTASPRRRALLAALYPQVTAVFLRGNLDTRLARVRAGDLDAIVVAQAGIERLGHGALVRCALDPDQFVPAPAQGALGIEARAHDTWALELIAPLDDTTTRRCAVAERSVLAGLGGGCQLPMGAHARKIPGGFALSGFYAAEGCQPLWVRRRGADPLALAEAVTAALGRR